MSRKSGSGRVASAAGHSVGTATATETKATPTQAQAMRYSIVNYQDRDRYVLVTSAHPALSAAQKIALIRLAFHVNFKTGRCDPAAVTLAKELGTDDRGLRRTLGKLERAGLLAIDRTRGRTSNQFTLMVPSIPSNPGQNARVEPGSNSPEQPSPTRVKMVANPGEFALPTARTVVGNAKAFPNGESEDASLRSLDHHAGGGLGGPPADSLKATKEEKKAATEEESATRCSALVITSLAADFQEFRAVYHRGHVKDDTERNMAEAFRAYQRARQTASHAAIMAGAHRAVEAADLPRYLDPPDVWLNARAWEREPPKKRGRSNGKNGLPHGGVKSQRRTYNNKIDPMKEACKIGGYVEDDDGGLVWGGGGDDDDDDDDEALVIGGLVQ